VTAPPAIAIRAAAIGQLGVYISSGPCDTRDVIIDAFGGAIDAEGILHWAPHLRREQPDDDELWPADAGTSNTNALDAELIERIVALSKKLLSCMKVGGMAWDITTRQSRLSLRR